MFFNVFYLFGMACSSLLWGGRFLNASLFLSDRIIQYPLKERF
ncbi:hypothetical protein HPNQ4110_1191 [Helicobacter pylori NQ4110]|nr:hypothetical protein HPNQ4110_1191 [Helicobacter pylori NQ4110]